jgi:hypothetical protein
MLMESVEEGCHFDRTPNYTDGEEDIPMHLSLPLLGVDNGNSVAESNLDQHSTDLCCGHLCYTVPSLYLRYELNILPHVVFSS